MNNYIKDEFSFILLYSMCFFRVFILIYHPHYLKVRYCKPGQKNGNEVVLMAPSCAGCHLTVPSRISVSGKTTVMGQPAEDVTCMTSKCHSPGLVKSFKHRTFKS